MDQALSHIFTEFAANPVVGGKAMRRLLESDPDHFLQSSLPLLRAAPQTQSFSYLLTLLLTNDLILHRLTDPDLFSFNEAVDLARRMLRIEPLLDVKLVRTLLQTKDLTSREELEKKADSDRGIRLLEIMAAISDGARILPVMAQLLRHPNSRVRSKAALLVGRSNKNYQWVEQRMTEPDERVRANAVESLWGVESEGARHVLWSAASDSDNRVAGNALHGLYQLGEGACIPLLLAMLKHPQEDFRTTAVWVMGETGDPRFLPVLASLMSDPESKIRAAVFRGIARLKQSIARFSSLPPLRIHAGQSQTLPQGWRETRVSVSGEHHLPLGALKPTQFVIHHGGAPITEYEVVEQSHTESLCMAFALPRVIGTSDDLHRSLQDSFARAILHKRKCDAWLTLRYQCEPERERINEVPGEPEPFTLPPDLRFSTEPESVLAAVSSPGSRFSSAPNMVQAARILLANIAGMRGSRHVVLIHHSVGGRMNPDELQDLVRTARASRTSLHVIATEPLPILTELCEKTGGFFVQQQELAQALEALCANLISHYQARFRVSGLQSETDPVRIQVFAEQGMGEEVVAFPRDLHLTNRSEAVLT